MTPTQREAALRLADQMSQPGATIDEEEAAALLRELAQEPVQEPEPAAECIDDICAEHFGRIETFSYLPAGTKLYAHPPQQRKPLTDEQIQQMLAKQSWDSSLWNVVGAYYREGVRAAERHHGITEAP